MNKIKNIASGLYTKTGLKIIIEGDIVYATYFNAVLDKK